MFNQPLFDFTFYYFPSIKSPPISFNPKCLFIFSKFYCNFIKTILISFVWLYLIYTEIFFFIEVKNLPTIFIQQSNYFYRFNSFLFFSRNLTALLILPLLIYRYLFSYHFKPKIQFNSKEKFLLSEFVISSTSLKISLNHFNPLCVKLFFKSSLSIENQLLFVSPHYFYKIFLLNHF